MDNGTTRKFESGATRDTATNKPDYAGYLSPAVIERFGQYMLKYQKQSDGTLRDSDNWQKGIPLKVYMSSAFRHFMDFWKENRGIPTKDGMEEALCALLFNVSGYLHEHLKLKNSLDTKEVEPPVKMWPVYDANSLRPLDSLPVGTYFRFLDKYGYPSKLLSRKVSDTKYTVENNITEYLIITASQCKQLVQVNTVATMDCTGLNDAQVGELSAMLSGSIKQYDQLEANLQAKYKPGGLYAEDELPVETAKKSPSKLGFTTFDQLKIGSYFRFGNKKTGYIGKISRSKRGENSYYTYIDKGGVGKISWVINKNADVYVPTLGD